MQKIICSSHNITYNTNARIISNHFPVVLPLSCVSPHSRRQQNVIIHQPPLTRFLLLFCLPMCLFPFFPCLSSFSFSLPVFSLFLCLCLHSLRPSQRGVKNNWCQQRRLKPRQHSSQINCQCQATL